MSVYIVYDLRAWPRNLTNNLNFKNCLICVTSLVKISDKEKNVYRGSLMTFESAGSWGFDNDTARNVIIFAVDNSSSSHAGNRKNTFLVLREGRIFEINRGFSSPDKKISTDFSKATTNV